METAIEVRTRAVSSDLFTWLKIGVFVVLIGALYADVIRDLASEWWTQPEASYGILIPPFAVYMGFLRRHYTFSLPAQPDLRGLALTAGACVIFLGGQMASEFFLTRISLVLLIGGLVWTFWGTARLRSIGFVLIFLMTMVPPPALLYNAAAAPLQLFASTVATNLAQLMGVSIFQDGNIIRLANVSLGVAEACSGLHSLSALLVASLLLGFLENGSILGRIAIFVLSVPLAIAVNVIRVTGTAVLADWKPELAMGYYHAFSGWLVFMIGLSMLWLMAKVVFRFTGAAS